MSNAAGAGRQAAWLAAGMACLAMAACTRAGPPAPVVYGGNAALYGQPSPGGPTTVVVQRGDSISLIARRYKVPLNALIAVNNLKPPYQVRIGQTLSLPAQRAHIVQKGESVHSIARRYRVDIPALVRINGLKAPFGVWVGQELAIPSSEARMAAAPVPATSAASPAAPAGAPAMGTMPGTPWQPAPSPGAETAVPVPVAATTSAPPAPAAGAQPANVNIPSPPPRSGQAFAWPVAGKLLARYGSMGEGVRNDGINIAAPAGTPVRAAEDGVVVYVGNELKGFGNLLLLKHADGWMTAYAHTATTAVKRGDKVSRGQAIGTVGSSGNVTAPQLHFEIRRGTKAIDPLPYMDTAAAV